MSSKSPKKKAVLAPAANPPQNDFQFHPGEPDEVTTAGDKDPEKDKIAEEVARRGTGSDDYEIHTGRALPDRDRLGDLGTPGHND